MKSVLIALLLETPEAMQSQYDGARAAVSIALHEVDEEALYYFVMRVMKLRRKQQADGGAVRPFVMPIPIRK